MWGVRCENIVIFRSNYYKNSLPTSNFPLQSWEVVKKMAYKITDKCIACGACAAECPVECIKQGEEKYVIDQESCIGCGTCAGVCPVEAPEEE